MGRFSDMPAERRALFDALRGTPDRPVRAVEIARRPENEPPVSSFAQQRLWIVNQLHADSAAYSLPAALRIEGLLDAALLEQSLRALVVRHEVLRTGFRTDRPEPQIRDELSIELPVIDVGSDAEIESIALSEARRPFDLTRPPLLRATLLRRSANDHVLVINLHHIIADGLSVQLIVRDIGALYLASVAGTPAALPPLRVRYSDHAAWQRSRLSSGALQSEFTYWTTRMAGAPPVLELPLDRPRPAFSAGHGDTISVHLPASTTEALRSGGRHGVTPFMTLLAAFDALLYHTTGVEDIVVGSTVAARSAPELASVVGLFANTILLRTSVEGNPTPSELVGRVRETILGALAHQELPFDTIVDTLRPEPGTTRTPFFGILFDFQDAPLQQMQLGDLTFTPLDLNNATAKFDLTVQVFNTPGGLTVHFEYDTELYDRATLETFVADYLRMLERFASAPDEPLGPPQRTPRRPEPQVVDEVELGDAVPRTPLEHELVAIWAGLLNRPASEIGVYDGFFALGGQSLLAIDLLELIHERFGTRLTLRTLFEDATVAGLAERIEARATAEVALPPLQRVPQRESYDLAPYQLPEWFMHELAPTSRNYNVCIGNVVFTGDLDRGAFEAAWRDLVARHGAFRTLVVNRDGRPRVHILPHLELDFTEVFVDRTSVPEDLVAAEMATIAWETSNILLDFENGPLFRVRLVEFSGRRFQFILLTHHIVWDERSMMNLGYELKELYNAHHGNRAPELPVLEVDYVDFAHWINTCIETGALEKQRRYWLDAFATLPEPLDLPFDFPRPALQTFNGTEVFGVLSAESLTRIDSFLQKHDTTLYILTYAVLNLLIHRITGRTDFVVGTPIANRNDKRLAPLLGLFATAMPMRCRIEEGMTFSGLLDAARVVSLGAYDNHAYPSILAIQEINPRMDASRNRLFSVMMGVQNNKAQIMTDLQFDDLALSYADGITLAEQETSRFDLGVIIDQLVGSTEIRFNFNTDLFKRETVERIHRQYLSLIDQVVADPSQLLTAYALDASDEQDVLAQFNDTARPADLGVRLHTLFERQARSSPDRIAVTNGQEALTYRQLDERADRLACRLEERGVTAGDRIAVPAERSIGVVAALLAVLKVGAAYVPIHPETPPDRVRSILAAAGVACVLAEADLADDPTHRAPPTVRCGDPASLAYVIFTSGTTGEPKGIEVEHRGLVNLVGWLQDEYTLTGDDAVLCVTSLAFDASVLEVFWPLCHGARVVIAPPGAEKDVSLQAATVDREQVTFLQTVPILLEELTRSRRRNEISPLPSLRLVICGSAALSRPQRDGFRAEFGARLVNHYGPTEVTVDAASFDCSREFDGDVVPIGTPVGNARIHLMDPDLRPVPLGSRGEIYVSSPGLARGYVGDPQRSADRFVPDPFSDRPGDRLYRTGDVGRIGHDGVLYFHGRIDRQVKVRGNRVELEEIEVRLAEHPHVEQCAVRLVSDRLVGFVSLATEPHSLVAGGVRYRMFTLAQRPELRRAMDLVHVDAWPEYFVGDCVLRSYWLRLVGELPQHQILLVNDEDELVAVGNSLPIHWNGLPESLPTGWDACLAQGFEEPERDPNTLVGLAIVVARGQEGRGLGTVTLDALRTVARGLGFERVIIPVRPTELGSRPDTGVEAYSRLRREDGLPVDGWLRIHERAGGRILGAAPRSQHIVATIAEWERWSRQSFPASGEYRVADALQPVRIDLEADRGEYWDPAIWVEHTLPASSGWAPVDAASLRTFLSRSLPPYMVPDSVRFLGRLPLTSNGKVDEKALGRQAESQTGARVAVPPEGPVQNDIAEIWRDILEIATVGVHDDFFDLGGHSLHAVRMLTRMNERMELRITLRDLFAHPTIFALEQLISDRGQEAS